MRAVVDPDVCTGCGTCVDICPDVFELSDDDDVAVVKVESIPGDAAEDCQEAADNCPVEAISIEE